MKTEIGQPCIHNDFKVLLFGSSSNMFCGSDEHVPFLDVNLMPSFAKLPTLNKAEAKNNGKNNNVKPQNINCIFNSVDGKPFFHVKSEHPEMK
jgi:hypothetical protein